MGTMTRPRTIPFRWDGHGIDIRAHITDAGQVYFFAGDVGRAIELTPQLEAGQWADEVVERWPARTITIPGLVDDTGHLVDVCTAAEVRHLAVDNPNYMTGDFLTWFDELLEQLDTATIEAALETRPPATETLPIAGGVTYSIATAAKILSRDPAIQVGQTALFETLRSLGWTDRVAGWWRAGQIPVRNGWCVIQPRRVPGHRDLYPQIRLTRQGLTELHKLMGGIADIDLAAGPALTLVEL